MNDKILKALTIVSFGALCGALLTFLKGEPSIAACSFFIGCLWQLLVYIFVAYVIKKI